VAQSGCIVRSSLRRIVPIGYSKHDSPTAQRLFEASILRDEEPRRLLDPVGRDMTTALQQNAYKLVPDYTIERAIADWDGYNWSAGSAQGQVTPELGWIHISKFPQHVINSLTALGLARQGRPVDPIRYHSGMPEDWIGLHPDLAGAYMTVLATRISQAAQFQPLTDQVELRQAIPNDGVESALRLLLGKDRQVTDTSQPEANETYIMLALQHVRPKGLSDIPVEKIIECRHDLSEELDAFREYVDSRERELAELASIASDHRQMEAFAEYVQQTIELPLQKLERGMRLHRLDPTRSLVLAGTFVPPAAASEALSALGAPPAVAATIGAAAAVGNAWWQVGNVRNAAKSNSPVGYILDVRDRLTPRTLPAYIRRIFRGTYSRSAKT
jgi:hypothetical protein